MSTRTYPEDAKTINLFFGTKHQDTLEEFDELSRDLSAPEQELCTFS
jgi:hypothetical protein